MEISKPLRGDYEDMLQKIFTSDECLSREDEEKISQEIKALDETMRQVQKLRLRLGRLYDYNALKKDGFSKENVQEFYREDEAFLQEVDGYYLQNLEKREYMFGYPANMQEYSYLSQYFRNLESKLYLMNNCGDPYQNGNYGMDSKAIERKIIALVAENFALKEEDVWGYITSGGTESNYWAIREGFRNYPNGKLYFSRDTHYSVEKFVSNDKKRLYNYEVIDSDADGAICLPALFSKIEEDVQKGVEGVILVLNWGTTCVGATDNVEEIVQFLTERKIPYYCHVDAALFGGIASNQINAPTVQSLHAWKVDSISVSMHKFIGSSRVNGVLLSVKNRKNRSVVEYIGQEDSTLLGSRDYLPFSMYQRVREMTKRCKPDLYDGVVGYFDRRLKECGIPFRRYKNSNIFVVDKPSERLCLKYQLATFTTDEGEEKAHILIFPFQKREVIEELLADLRKERK